MSDRGAGTALEILMLRLFCFCSRLLRGRVFFFALFILWCLFQQMGCLEIRFIMLFYGILYHVLRIAILEMCGAEDLLTSTYRK